MKRTWSYLMRRHRLFDEIVFILVAFSVGGQAQAGKLDTASIADAIGLFIAITLAAIVVLDVLLLVLIGLRKLIRRP